jgi:hypothetical protein
MAKFSRRKEFQISDAELIHPEIVIPVEPLDAADMLQVRVLGIFQVVDDGARRNYSLGELFDPKPFQGMGLKML